MVHPETNSLLVLYDDAQSINRRKGRLGFSFAEVGIQARGRTTILRMNYRNTASQRFEARAFSIVVRLSCRKNAISDELNTVCAREVACFRLREEVEAVSECVLPPAFKFAAMFVSQRSQRFCGRRQFGRPWLASQSGACVRCGSIARCLFRRAGRAAPRAPRRTPPGCD